MLVSYLISFSMVLNYYSYYNILFFIMLLTFIFLRHFWRPLTAMVRFCLYYCNMFFWRCLAHSDFWSFVLQNDINLVDFHNTYFDIFMIFMQISIFMLNYLMTWETITGYIYKHTHKSRRPTTGTRLSRVGNDRKSFKHHGNAVFSYSSKLPENNCTIPQPVFIYQ